MIKKRSSFGTIEKLASGRYRARYKSPLTGRRISAPITYTRKTDAQLWLKQEELALARGTWSERAQSSETLDAYGKRWIETRSLKADTRVDYLAIWRLHVSPCLGEIPIQNLRRAMIADWRNQRLSQGFGIASISYAYRVLKAVCNTAFQEEIISSNPCQLLGASSFQGKKHSTLNWEEVFKLAHTVAPRYRALVLFLVFTGMRIGEATALTLNDLNLDSEIPEVSVSKRVKAKRSGGGFSFDSPKTSSGVRKINLPVNLIPILKEHINLYTKQELNSYLFSTKLGNPAVSAGSDEIRKALRKIGKNDVRTHDLRHTSATLAMELGIPSTHLQARLGHASSQSTAIYLHSSNASDVEIAKKLSSATQGFEHYLANLSSESKLQYM